MQKASVAASLALVIAAVFPSFAAAAGPDVIVGFVDDGREDSRSGSKVGLTASTNSCNRGDATLNWRRLPDTQHPAITLNFYRMSGGRIEQLAQSWVKHGFFATNQNDCELLPEVNKACEAGFGGNQLRPGCSDYYSEALNADPAQLGPRSRITNAATGAYDGALAKDLTGYPPSSDAERILLVEEGDLSVPGARYFVESYYLAADDAAAGNARNNATYREVTPVLRLGAWDLPNAAPEVRLQPAVAAWQEEGAQLSEIEGLEGGVKTYIIVGSKASSTADGRFHYEYVVHNMNSDLAVQSLSIPAAGVDPASVGFRGVTPNGEIWSSEPWQHRIENGQITWAGKTYDEDQNASAIRWGSTYNFWFDSDAGPGKGDATIAHFKPASGNTYSTATTQVVAPAP